MPYDKPERLSRAEQAAKLGMTVRNLRRVLAEKTTSRGLAERLCELLGGIPEEYMRPALKRGRHRSLVGLFMKIGAEEFPFKKFVEEAEVTDAESDREYIIIVFQALYTGRDIHDAEAIEPPDDFETLDELSAFVRHTQMPIGLRDVVSALWDRFKVWRIQGVAALAVSEIEEGSLHDFG